MMDVEYESNAAAYSLLEFRSVQQIPQHPEENTTFASSSRACQERQRLQQHFENKAGIRPSQCWLEECLSHIIRTSNRENYSGIPSTSSSGGENRTEDEVWNQILHADLRDVVRGSSHSSATIEDDDSQVFTATRQLRNAIHQSNESYYANRNNVTTSNLNFQSTKVTLPATFQLLVQIEEIVDVTMNSEQQLAAASGNPSNDTSRQHQQSYGSVSRNSKYRCLKMIISDGYHPDGNLLSEANQNSEDKKENIDHIILARETSPILNLSVLSSPGTKLVLHGPIDVRCGMLELNDGNCLVAGGQIDCWKSVRSKAKEKAQRERGLGIDPTIKALIWNPVWGDEDEGDEGEGESGDVQVAPVTIISTIEPTPSMLVQAQSILPAQPIITPNEPIHTTAYPNNSNFQANSYPRQNCQAASPLYNNTTQPSYFDTSGRENNLRQTTLDAFPKKPRPQTTRLLPKNNIKNHQRHHLDQQRNIPPNQNMNNSIVGRQNSHFSNNINAPRLPPPTLPHVQNTHSNIISMDDTSPNSTIATTSKPQQPVQFNPYVSLRQSSSLNVHCPPSNVTNSIGATKTATCMSSTAFVANPSFSELKLILQSIRYSRTLYEKYYGEIITVPCKIGQGNVFNIVRCSQDHGDVYSSSGGGDEGEKKKKEKTKKEKKYEFYLVGKFMGPKQSDGAIACRIDNSLVEPYFTGYSAAQLRKLSREDTDRANQIVNQGSSQFMHDFSSLRQFQLKLILSVEEFFTKISALPSSSSSGDDWMTDANNPLFLVIN